MNQITDEFNETARLGSEPGDPEIAVEAARSGAASFDENDIAGDTTVDAGIEPIMPFLPDPDLEFRDDRQDASEAAAQYGPRGGRLISLGTDLNVVVAGASGGIGAAITDILEEDPAVSRVFAFSRSGSTPFGGNIVAGHIDLAQERSIARAAAAASSAQPIHLVVVASGSLDLGSEDGSESGLRSLDGVAMASAYQVNAIGPALVAKHFLPLMPRTGKSVFAVLSDNVDRFQTNQDPGLLGYSGSKSALNTIIGGVARELAREGRETTCVGLFPGVVDTPMSRPLQKFAAEDQLFSPDFAAERLIKVIDDLVPSDGGALLAWDGSVISAGI